MNLEKVTFAFFIILALTLNFGFFIGDIDNAVHRSVYELFAAIVVSLIATIMKFGDRSLLCGRFGFNSRLEWITKNSKVFDYLVSGKEGASGILWKRFSSKQAWKTRGPRHGPWG